MTHSMWLVRRRADGSIKPMGDPITHEAVTTFIHDTDLGGVVGVEPIDEFEGFDYLVTFSIDFIDAQGTVEYLTNFDPRTEFPEVPASSHWILFQEA